MSTVGKSTETESRLIVAQTQGGSREQLLDMRFLWGTVKLFQTDCSNGCTTLNIVKPLNGRTVQCATYMNKVALKKKKIMRMNVNAQHSACHTARIRVEKCIRDFPGGPVVKNPPSNAGNVDLIPSLGTRSHMPGATKPTHGNQRSQLTTAKTQCSQNFTRERRQDEVVKYDVFTLVATVFLVGIALCIFNTSSQTYVWEWVVFSLGSL